MFGEIKDSIKVSENVYLCIPDVRVCKTCTRYKPTTDGSYISEQGGHDPITHYFITCENEGTCRYIFNQLEALLDEHLDDEFHGIFKEGLNGKLKEEKEEEHGQTI